VAESIAVIAHTRSKKKVLSVFRTIYWGLFSFHSCFLSLIFLNGDKLKLLRRYWLCSSANFKGSVLHCRKLDRQYPGKFAIIGL